MVWYSCVGDFELDLASVAISSMHRGFEKLACVLKRKKRKCFQIHSFKGFVVAGKCLVIVLRHLGEMPELLLVVWLCLFPWWCLPSGLCVLGGVCAQ